MINNNTLQGAKMIAIETQHRLDYLYYEIKKLEGYLAETELMIKNGNADYDARGEIKELIRRHKIEIVILSKGE